MKILLLSIILLLGLVFATSTFDSPTTVTNDTLTTCVDLNSASFDELQTIAHIGIDEAISILKFRNVADFRFADDLSYIRGVSSTELSNIKFEGLACVRN